MSSSVDQHIRDTVHPRSAGTENPLAGFDVSLCENEPIHIPGAIQPHGALLAAVMDGLLVSHASANLAEIFGRPAEQMLGRSLEQAIGVQACRALLDGKPASGEESVQKHRLITPDGRAFALRAFRSGRHICLDIEQDSPAESTHRQTNLAQKVLESFEYVSSVAELCELAVSGLKEISGYDRVMAYRFGENGHGQVIAEAREAHLEPFLGHSYPATDIPAQARRLYLRQRVGAIANSNYVAVPVLADPALDDGTPLDLTHSVLRSVSPIHLEYMRNMNTSASLTIGLRHRGELWGMLVCHHATSRIAGPELRTAAGMIGRVVSLLIESLGEAEAMAGRLQRSATLRELTDAVAAGKPLLETLGGLEPQMLHLVGAGGVLLRFSGAVSLLGRTPPAAVAERVLSELLEQAGEHMLSVHDLGQHGLEGCAEHGSGALLLPLAPHGTDAILWFRPELARTVIWAGDPAKHGTRDARTGRISPRASFDSWREIVRGCSAPWSDVDRTLAGEFRKVIQGELVRHTLITLELNQRQSAKQLLEFIRQAPISIAIFDREMRYLANSDRWLQDYCDGYEEVTGRSHYDVLPDLPQQWREIHQRGIAGETQQNDEDLWTCNDGSKRWVRWAVAPWIDSVGAVGGIIISTEDITGRKLADERIVHLGTHDGLTGLANLVHLEERIGLAIEDAQLNQRKIALLLLDLDHFKVVNDGYGHAFGDAVLRAAAARIREMLRSCDTAARIGGDEFLVLATELYKRADAYVVAQRILDGFRRPFSVGGREVFLTASIGVSLFPSHGNTAAQLIGDADIAMYRAKHLQRDNFIFFTSEMSEAAQSRAKLEGELRFALERKQLTLVYQPKVELGSGHISGCEALLRWHHPELGAISPGQFIPIAEDTGLILSIGDWVLRTACAQLKAWQDAALPPIVMSINLSVRQFRQEDIVRWVRDVLVECEIDPKWVELELTESILADDAENVIDVVDTFKRMGLKLSIDDFGTGFSSLAYLKRFRVDTLKIDQTFIRNMLMEPDDRAIVRAIIGLAHNLNMTVIAEGVETQEQCDFLRNNQCEAIQGYLFSKPVAADVMGEMLRSGKKIA
jgi:diguanylate cyclase (GGDEF)-like protein/PAS domain S-box-containing protein